ncbi:unnamed protein product [Didymodactylos carnosus]|uniref:Uncharacterized protein n=1 Tax=Didymodactylos carnosus TaxID=1234261 RepID=A0A813U3K6_9BILA|nr:unnamed protein product [Didymodactylos carnosus]CAF3609806.1 unnamed protein product [Didymodactylos carnosus]
MHSYLPFDYHPPNFYNKHEKFNELETWHSTANQNQQTNDDSHNSNDNWVVSEQNNGVYEQQRSRRCRTYHSYCQSHHYHLRKHTSVSHHDDKHYANNTFIDYNEYNVPFECQIINNHNPYEYYRSFEKYSTDNRRLSSSSEPSRHLSEISGNIIPLLSQSLPTSSTAITGKHNQYSEKQKHFNRKTNSLLFDQVVEVKKVDVIQCSHLKRDFHQEYSWSNRQHERISKERNERHHHHRHPKQILNSEVIDSSRDLDNQSNQDDFTVHPVKKQLHYTQQLICLRENINNLSYRELHFQQDYVVLKIIQEKNSLINQNRYRVDHCQKELKLQYKVMSILLDDVIISAGTIVKNEPCIPIQISQSTVQPPRKHTTIIRCLEDNDDVQIVKSQLMLDSQTSVVKVLDDSDVNTLKNSVLIDEKTAKLYTKLYDDKNKNLDKKKQIDQHIFTRPLQKNDQHTRALDRKFNIENEIDRARINLIDVVDSTSSSTDRNTTDGQNNKNNAQLVSTLEDFTSEDTFTGLDHGKTPRYSRSYGTQSRKESEKKNVDVLEIMSLSHPSVIDRHTRVADAHWNRDNELDPARLRSYSNDRRVTSGKSKSPEETKMNSQSHNALRNSKNERKYVQSEMCPTIQSRSSNNKQEENEEIILSTNESATTPVSYPHYKHEGDKIRELLKNHPSQMKHIHQVKSSHKQHTEIGNFNDLVTGVAVNIDVVKCDNSQCQNGHQHHSHKSNNIFEHEIYQQNYSNNNDEPWRSADSIYLTFNNLNVEEYQNEWNSNQTSLMKTYSMPNVINTSQIQHEEYLKDPTDYYLYHDQQQGTQQQSPTVLKNNEETIKDSKHLLLNAKQGIITSNSHMSKRSSTVPKLPLTTTHRRTLQWLPATIKQKLLGSNLNMNNSPLKEQENITDITADIITSTIDTKNSSSSRTSSDDNSTSTSITTTTSSSQNSSKTKKQLIQKAKSEQVTIKNTINIENIKHVLKNLQNSLLRHRAALTQKKHQQITKSLNNFKQIQMLHKQLSLTKYQEFSINKSDFKIQQEKLIKSNESIQKSIETDNFNIMEPLQTNLTQCHVNKYHHTENRQKEFALESPILKTTHKQNPLYLRALENRHHHQRLSMTSDSLLFESSLPTTLSSSSTLVDIEKTKTQSKIPKNNDLYGLTNQNLFENSEHISSMPHITSTYDSMISTSTVDVDYELEFSEKQLKIASTTKDEQERKRLQNCAKNLNTNQIIDDDKQATFYHQHMICLPFLCQQTKPRSRSKKYALKTVNKIDTKQKKRIEKRKHDMVKTNDEISLSYSRSLCSRTTNQQIKMIKSDIFLSDNIDQSKCRLNLNNGSIRTRIPSLTKQMSSSFMCVLQVLLLTSLIYRLIIYPYLFDDGAEKNQEQYYSFTYPENSASLLQTSFKDNSISSSTIEDNNNFFSFLKIGR